ncbi:outer membrane lipoprotein carrier protein LolA [Gilvimarinus xylanilyticus]|uniref:Outer membrane lipoprotein carrier protein LolA n=1 Tax=Gilvimarinus xylanilyticus TaxID=2944139 RepID=A0A9X2I639_9GAMM|nr:outer membrane lipoprotein carrier protein LolA [Gilvimarinus xylanilyticus]MCP8900127.1 outer membrane lipoprotein carrier protein LolA [Gilvimarinus xylanilyticus]
MIRFGVFLGGLFFSLGCAAQGVLDYPVNSDAQRDRLESIAQAVRDSLPLGGDVRQEKHLSVLAEPIIGKGSFALSAEGTIDWQLHEPFAVRYKVNGEKIVRLVDGEQEVITPSAEPSVYGFFRMFEQLFALKPEQLYSVFTLYLAPAANNEWHMALVPQKAPLADVVDRLLVTGSGGLITQVTIAESDDDYTLLEFSYPDRETR